MIYYNINQLNTIARVPLKANQLYLGFFLSGLFILAPFIDALTGYFVLSGLFSESFIGSPSQVLRALLFLVGLRLLSERYFYYVLLISAYFIGVECISFSNHLSWTGLITGLVFSYKLVFSISVYLVLQRNISLRRVGIERLMHLFISSGFLYAAGVILPFILGIGFPTYDEGAFGTKGFYASGNGLGMYVGIVSCLYFYIYKNKSILFWLTYTPILIALLLIGTKAALVFLILNVLLWVNSVKLYVRIIILAFLTFLLAVFKQKVVLFLGTVYDVVLLRYKQSDSLVQFLFSGREKYVADAFEQFNISGFMFYRLIIGSGSFLSFRDPFFVVGAFDTLETDMFDVFFMYGIIGVIAFLVLVAYLLLDSLKTRQFTLLIFLFAVFTHSIMAGHVLFNGMSAIGLVVLIIYNLNNNSRYFWR